MKTSNFKDLGIKMLREYAIDNISEIEDMVRLELQDNPNSNRVHLYNNIKIVRPGGKINVSKVLNLVTGKISKIEYFHDAWHGDILELKVEGRDFNYELRVNDDGCLDHEVLILLKDL